jgi:hypothetical protein
MRFEEEELDRLADRLAEKFRDRMPSRVTTSSEGKIHGLDPDRLYTAKQVADRWSVSETTVRRNLKRTDWNGDGVRFRGIDILRYEGVDMEASPSSQGDEPSDESDPPEPGGDGRKYDGQLPEI